MSTKAWKVERVRVSATSPYGGADATLLNPGPEAQTPWVTAFATYGAAQREADAWNDSPLFTRPRVIPPGA